MVLLASDYDQSRFLRAADVPVERKFRIKNVTEEMVGTDKDKQRKLVCWFTNDRRGLVLNQGNNRTIRGAYGDPVAGWTNKIIVIFPAMTEVRGEMKPALRVRMPPPKQPSAAPVVTPQQLSGNGAAVAVKPETATPPTKPVPVDDPELAPDPVKPLSDELDDEIPW
jgi:hypothetical protein